METVNIFNTYKVYLGSGILKDIPEIFNLDNFSKIIVITDKNVPTSFFKKFEKIIVPSGEQFKNIETVKLIWEKMLKLGCDRKSLVINLGGGVIGDMGGFAASCYMRGVKFLQVPTTLLSAVDASVGGKVGVDFNGVKNLIGTFNQPIGVVIDIDAFNSLPDREFISGFGEIIKHGIITDEEYFKFVTSKKPREFSNEELIGIIKRSCEIKAQIISEDERESGSRKLLNFGHTIGHALESFSLGTDKPLLHGEAVSLGMLVEAKISADLGMITPEDVKKIKESLASACLPVNYKAGDLDEIMDLISKDKKSEKGKINWTLIRRIGKGVINQEVSKGVVKKSLALISK